MRTYLFSKLVFILLIVFFTFTGLQKVHSNTKTSHTDMHRVYVPIVHDSIDNKVVERTENDPILQAEQNADEAGRAVLEIGRKMALEEKTIVKGSCWDFINEVFKRAGFAENKKIIFNSPKSGPYIDVSLIKPGDWLYYINYSYNQVEHSGIFIYWADYENKIGVTLSYGGEHRNEPGRYRAYDLKSVYYITRADKSEN